MHEVGSAQWRSYLAFRDALRKDHVRRDAYAALKKDLARRFPSDRRSYLAAKATFIRETLALLPRPDPA
ncbi:MAG: GrpB family protein [Chloroflexi bacterium]|nr:MAG: GrpB family protein [Chloroflexota bacterium]